jgi:tRNA threonylcarbamoyladenosine biosynthesis protein TsaB
MVLLATDTSGKTGSIALARAPDGVNGSDFSASAVELLEFVPLTGGTFSAQLVPQIATLLTKNGLGVHDIDAFVVATGPGSFTGLRVGLAAIKALAEVLRKPIVSVSLLEAAAHDLMLKGLTLTEEPDSISPVVIAFDASRREVFLGQYEVNSRLPIRNDELLVTLDELAKLSNQWGQGKRLFTPDTAVWEFLKANVKDACLFNAYRTDRPDSASIARLGALKLQAGEIVSANDLEANYIRRSDAEILAKDSR